MGWISRILGGVSRQEMDGIHLDPFLPHWEVTGETDFPRLLSALPTILPDQSILYFEGGSPSGELLEFLRKNEVPEPVHVACGTIWPRPLIVHVPATPETITRLSELTESCAFPELAIHFHVYHDQSVILEWHDVFAQPMLLSGELPEERVRAFSGKLQMSYSRGR